MHPTAAGLGRATVLQCLSCPVGAAQLVVAGLDVVDGIVKPECHSHFAGPLRLFPDAVELAQAFGQMLLGVIVALGFGPGREQALQQICGRRKPQGLPCALPGGLEQGSCDVHGIALSG